MSTNTTNYGLIKPSEEDYYNIEDFNGNIDIVDCELKKVSDVADNINDKIFVLEEALYNPNLLINSNFKSRQLINQREESSYNSKGYCIDMWYITCASSQSFLIDVSLDNLKMSIHENELTNPYVNLLQKIENYNDYVGKTVTLSMKVKGDYGKQVRFGFATSGAGNKWFDLTGDWQMITYTVTISAETSSLNYVVVQLNGNESHSIEIEYVKLENGSVATEFVDDDPATKLSKCQRYLEVISGETPVGYLIHSSAIAFNIPLFPKRIATGLIQSSSDMIRQIYELYISGNSKNYVSNISNITIWSTSKKSILLLITLDTKVDNFTANGFCYMRILSSENILLSAEL